jgi:GNAT superfamily N-acetyltransferase
MRRVPRPRSARGRARSSAGRPGAPAGTWSKRRRGSAASGPVAFRIRRGGPRDAATILRLIRGLAEYERLAHQVQATIGRIRRHGFGRRPYFETLICRRDGRAVGFALYFFTYSTFLARPSLYLEDLFVVPDERGRGAGKALLAALARIAVRRGCGRMEWTVLDWNRPAIAFYRRLGAALHREWILTRLTGAPLRRLGS